MYNGELNFICVFTQERTLRFFSKSDEIYFDIMIIDEAHNLLDNDQRSVILSRVIRRNRFRNSSSKHYYLSPLINDSNNLKLDEGQEFFERKIKINIKEPDYFEFKENGDFLSLIGSWTLIIKLVKSKICMIILISIVKLRILYI